MTVFSLIVVALLVFGVLGAVALALFELTPAAHRENPYRDPVTGLRRFESVHLETWDEFEQRTHDNLR